MTEYEIADLTFSLVGYGMAAMTLYFSVVSGYLAVAFMTGARLSRSQMSIITSLFVVFSLSLVFGTYSFFDSANSIAGSVSGSIEFWLAPVIGVAELMGIMAAFKFMLDIRRDSSANNSAGN